MLPDMNDDGHVDVSAHDQTPDVPLDTALSIREAAAQADVTEKTIRRWIKNGRLHAVKLGGQYRITVATSSVPGTPMSRQGTCHVQTPDTAPHG